VKMLRIAWYLNGTHCLGVGNRFAVWVQGCRKRCEGCIAEPLQNLEGGQEVAVSFLVSEIVNAENIEGLSISGGEPFLQASALTELIEEVQKIRPELGVILYTGMLYEEWLKHDEARNLLQKIDLLIDGAYISSLDDGKGMRGSSNQRLLFLTDRYHEWEMPNFRSNEVQFSNGYFRVIGIPSKAVKLMIDTLKREDLT